MMSDLDLGITTLVILNCAIFAIAGYVIFAVLVSHQANPVEAKRWKAAVVIGIIQGMLIVFLLIVLGIYLLLSAVFQKSGNPSQVDAAGLIKGFQAILSLGGCLTCLTIPTMFMATIGSYLQFFQTGDLWVEKFSKYLK